MTSRKKIEMGIKINFTENRHIASAQCGNYGGNLLSPHFFDKNFVKLSNVFTKENTQVLI